MANSRVDLPQPDSPTMPMNSPAARSKLMSSTARTVPCSKRYSTDRSRTSRTVPGGRPARLGSCHLARWARTLRMLRAGRRAGLPISSKA